LAANFKTFFSGEAPDFDYSSIAQKGGSATRAASAVVLAHFA